MFESRCLSVPWLVAPWLVQRTRTGNLFSVLPLDYFQPKSPVVAKQEIEKMREAVK